jgi:hypothetical protein
MAPAIMAPKATPATAPKTASAAPALAGALPKGDATRAIKRALKSEDLKIFIKNLLVQFLTYFGRNLSSTKFGRL